MTVEVDGHGLLVVNVLHDALGSVFVVEALSSAMVVFLFGQHLVFAVVTGVVGLVPIQGVSAIWN